MTRVLVTGAAGFLGGRVLQHLRDRGIPVVGTTRAERAGYTRCDLTDSDAVSALLASARPSVVVHCAASVPREAADYGDESAARDSVRMVENLVAAGSPPIVFASSMTVYPDHVEVAREPDAVAQGNGYAAGKFAAERVLAERDTDVALRLPGLFGPPRRAGLLYNAAVAFAAGRDFRADPAAPRWAALHVDDAATMMVRAIDLPRGHHVLNVGYDERMATADAVDRLAVLFGRTPASDARRWFRFDLTRCHQTLGAVPKTSGERLEEMAAWGRVIAGEAEHARAS